MRISVLIDAPLGATYAYLADPRNRPQWQSSLRSVRLYGDPGAAPHQGMRWRDLTWPGVRPLMEITRFEPDRVWSERGWWGGLVADLELGFVETAEGTRVDADFALSGRGPWRPLAMVLERLAAPAVRSDLLRAARNLSPRSPEAG